MPAGSVRVLGRAVRRTGVARFCGDLRAVRLAESPAFVATARPRAWVPLEAREAAPLADLRVAALLRVFAASLPRRAVLVPDLVADVVLAALVFLDLLFLALVAFVALLAMGRLLARPYSGRSERTIATVAR